MLMYTIAVLIIFRGLLSADSPGPQAECLLHGMIFDPILHGYDRRDRGKRSYQTDAAVAEPGSEADQFRESPERVALKTPFERVELATG